MALRAKPAVNAGEQFERIDLKGSVWEVQYVFEVPHSPSHARIQEYGGNGRTCTVSVAALLDNRFYRRVGANSP